MNIAPVQVAYTEDLVTVSSQIESKKFTGTLWFSLPKEYSQYLIPDRLDAFLIANLFSCSKYHEDIYLDGKISEKLFYNLTNYYLPIVKSAFPYMRIPKIVAKELDNGQNIKSEGRVVAGFSGGIDSFAVLHDHFYKCKAPSFTLTHLIFNNVGPKDTYLNNKDQYSKLEKFVKKLNLPFFLINSNLYDFFDVEFITVNTLNNLAPVMLLQKLFSKYIYASGYHYRDTALIPFDNHGFGHADTAALHLLSTELMDYVLSGAQYRRVEKTELVATMPQTHSMLDVCASAEIRTNNMNCGVCSKCLRTLLTLEILGKKHLYSNVFKMSDYEKAKHRYIQKVLRMKSTFDNEIIEKAQEVGFKFRKMDQVLALTPIYDTIAVLRKIKKKYYIPIKRIALFPFVRFSRIKASTSQG